MFKNNLKPNLLVKTILVLMSVSVIAFVGLLLIKKQKQLEMFEAGTYSFSVNPSGASSLNINDTVQLSLYLNSSGGDAKTMLGRIVWDPTQFDIVGGGIQSDHGLNSLFTMDRSEGFATTAYIPWEQGGVVTIPSGDTKLFTITLKALVANPSSPFSTSGTVEFIGSVCNDNGVCDSGENVDSCFNDCAPLSNVIINTEIIGENSETYNPQVDEEFTLDVVMDPNGDIVRSYNIGLSYSPMDLQYLGDLGTGNTSVHQLSSQTNGIRIYKEATISYDVISEREAITHLRFKRISNDQTAIQFYQSQLYVGSTPEEVTLVKAQTSNRIFNAVTCTKEYPERPTNLIAVPGSQAGTVQLTWTKSVSTVTHYAIAYGEEWMNFIYGSPNVGDVNQYVVSGLIPGKLYYFVVTAVNDCALSGYSDGASAIAKSATVCISNQKVCVDTSSYKQCLADGSGWEDPVACDPGYECLTNGECTQKDNYCSSIGARQCSSSGIPQVCQDNTWVDATPCLDSEVCTGAGVCESSNGAITLKIKYQGVEANQENVSGPVQTKVALYEKTTGVEDKELFNRLINFTYDFSTGNFISDPISVEGVDFSQIQTLIVLVKGPKHLGREFVMTPSAVMDLTSKPILPGDLPINNGVQDYDVDINDYLAIDSRLTVYGEMPNPENITEADVNFDGVVNNQDKSLIRATLSIQYDEYDESIF